jgi:excisionase family DNA binding protein
VIRASETSAEGPLALGPAARLVGVDPDTLRRWADDGHVAVFTTPGGHRRFDRRELQRLARTRSARGKPAPLASLGATPDRLSRAYRRSYSSEPDERRVRASVTPADRDAFRRDGRRLVEALLAHLDAANDAERDRTESAAVALVDDLAVRLAGAGVDGPAAIDLFVAARRPFLSELGSIARRRQLGAARLVAAYESASAVLDRLLVRFVATHAEARA